MGQNEKLKILVVAAECVPYAKVGGMADVVGSLPLALRELGHDVRVVIPKYLRIDEEKFGLSVEIPELQVPFAERTERVSVMRGTMGKDVPVYLIKNAWYFDREGIYAHPDDDERFILFSRAAIEMLKVLDWIPDVIHANDWHTAIIPNWMKTIYRGDPQLGRTATVYTIHNLAYQGVFGYRVLEVAGINTFGFVYPQISELANVVDFMGRGILFADAINTVSERYAQEILTPEFGEKLDPLLRDRKDRVFGILNGIDVDLMDPATDKYLAANFDANNLGPRVENKLALQREAGLQENPDIPLIGMISRLADQKGFDILGAIIEPMLRLLNVQLVILGTGDPRYHDMLSGVQDRFRGKMSVFLTFNAALAQKIYGGTDMFLMPSRFEPCGLGQLIAMRYGSVPIVRSTGGLADTVQDFDSPNSDGNGFAFESYESMALYESVVRALENYKYKDSWNKLMVRDMSADYSWAASARKYVDMYMKAAAFKEAEVAEWKVPQH